MENNNRAKYSRGILEHIKSSASGIMKEDCKVKVDLNDMVEDIHSIANYVQTYHLRLHDAEDLADRLDKSIGKIKNEIDSKISELETKVDNTQFLIVGGVDKEGNVIHGMASKTDENYKALKRIEDSLRKKEDRSFGLRKAIFLVVFSSFLTAFATAYAVSKVQKNNKEVIYEKKKTDK
jgi:hypothetical protein